MLSTIPKLVDKAFIIGFLVPVILFFVALLFLFSDFPWVSDILTQKINDIEKILYISLLVWTFSIFMMMVNHLLYQVVEGYRWPISKLAGARSRELRRFEKKTQRFDELNRQWIVAGDQFPDACKREYDKLLIELVTEFPSDQNFLLPTRFGNAIRAFEGYSKQVYGADSIPLWVHLTTVIPKEFQASLEDARTQVSCLLNIMFFAAIIFVLSIFRFMLSLSILSLFNTNFSKFWDIFRSESMTFAFFAFCAASLAWLTYQFSIEKIYEWGSLVKAAFDCYLPDLAKRLGYELPLTGDDQKKFWISISRRAIFHRAIEPEEWPHVNDSDQGAECKKINTAASTENVCEESGTEANDAKDEFVKNEEAKISQ